MIQLYAYKDSVRYELDTYKEEPIKLTISAEDITDIPKIESSFSRQFRIPATSNNAKFFNWWFEMDVLDFDVTQVVQAEIHIDGLIFKSGELRLQAAYKNDSTDNIDLEVVFFGETRDFATQLGDIFLSELQAPELSHILDLDYIRDTENLVPANGGILRYGLAVKGYVYSEDNTWDPGGIDSPQPDEMNGQVSYNNARIAPFNNHQDHITPRQYTPFVQVKYLMDKIFDRTSYTYTSDSIFNEAWFANLYTDGITTADGLVPPNANGDALILGEDQQLDEDVEVKVNYSTKVTDGYNSFNLTTDTYTVPFTSTSTYQIQAILNVTDFHTIPTLQTDFTGKMYHKEFATGNITIIGQTVVSVANGYQQLIVTNQTMNTFDEYDQIWITVEATKGGPLSSVNRPQVLDANFTVNGGPDAVSSAGLLKNDVKIVDFFKSILNRFRLVMVPSKTKPLEFVIKPWKDYIASSSDVFDWTKKLDNNKDITIKPIFFDQSAVIDFTDVEDIDRYNELHRDDYNFIYGRRLYDSQNLLLKDTREIENVFAPTPVHTLEGSNNFADKMIIPYFAKEHQEQEDETSGQGLNTEIPLIIKPRLLYWNGMKPVSDEWFDENDNQAGRTTYSQFSPHFQIPPVSTTIDLNWQKDIRYFAPSNTQGISVYDAYWADYIDSLYSKDARLITAYFTLDPEDLKNLTFDDVIFIKNNYYRVQKVYDAPLNMESIIKVDLIKLLDYVPTIEAVVEDPVEEPVEEPVDNGTAGTSGTGGGGVPAEGDGEAPSEGDGEAPAPSYVVLNAEANFPLLRDASQYSTAPASGATGYYTGYYILLNLRDPATGQTINKSDFEAGGVIEFRNLTNNGSGDYNFFAKIAYDNYDQIFVRNGNYAQINGQHVINNNTGSPLGVHRTLRLFAETANTEIRVYPPGTHPSGLS